MEQYFSVERPAFCSTEAGDHSFRIEKFSILPDYSMNRIVMISKHHILFLFLFLSTLFLTTCTYKSVDQNEVQDNGPGKPNVVFILADDLGVHDLGITGSDYYETPNIDYIARTSTIFTQGYATCRVCSPSRASIMLGKFPARHGITDWIGASAGADWREKGHNDKLIPADYVHDLPKKDITLAEAMKEAGYTTFFAGKWHLGSEGSWPKDHGFDYNLGGWDSGSPRGGYFSPWTNPNLPNTEKGENLSMRLARETTRFIEEHRDTPFLAYLSFYAVHAPIQTTEAKWRKYRDKAAGRGIADHGFEMESQLPIRVVQDNPVYGGLIEQMDDAVGLVLTKLKALGLDSNTIIIFTSDNGGVVSGDAYSTSNLPLRGGKGYQWEGGIREPYFIHVPWMENAPSEIEVPVTGTDFYPTILDLIDIPLRPEQHCDGISLVPLLKGDSIPDRPLYWHYPHYGNQGGDPSSMIRIDSWKLIYYWEDNHEELYNLEHDPKEQNDVSREFPVKTKELSDQLKNFLLEVNANSPKPNPEYSPALAKEQYERRVNVLLPRLEEQRLKFLSPDFQPNENWWDSKKNTD